MRLSFKVDSNFREARNRLMTLLTQLKYTTQARLRWKTWVHRCGSLRTSPLNHSKRGLYTRPIMIWSCSSLIKMRVSDTKAETIWSAWLTISACSRPRSNSGTLAFPSNTVYQSSNSSWSCLTRLRLSSMIHSKIRLKWPNRATRMTRKWTSVSRKGQLMMISTSLSLQQKFKAGKILKVSPSTTEWWV